MWHPEEAWMLASGSFDKTITLMDCRNGSMLQPVPLPTDIECLAWDPFRNNHLYCSLEDGQVLCIDIRLLNNVSTTGKSRIRDAIILQFPAHEKTVSSLDFSSCVPGLCATSSTDETIKIWDMHSPSSTPQRIVPKNVFYKSMNVGNLFSINFCKDEPFLLATGGESGIVAVWDCDEQQIIKDYFNEREILQPVNPYLGLISSTNNGLESDIQLENIENENGEEGLKVGEEAGEDGDDNGMDLIKKNDDSNKKKKKKSKKKN